MDTLTESMLIVDGVDMHAVMILIALMSYDHTRAVGPTSSMTRGPPIDEISNAPGKRLVSSSSGGSMPVWLLVWLGYTIVQYVHQFRLCVFVRLRQRKRSRGERIEDAPPNSNHSNPFNELSRHLGTPNKINATEVASFRYLFCGFRLP